MKENITIIEAKPYKFALVPPCTVIVNDGNGINDYRLSGSHMFPLLQKIVNEKGVLIPTELLFDAVWNDSDSDLNRVQKTVYALKKKVPELRDMIDSVKSIGYQLINFQRVYHRSALSIEFVYPDSERIIREYRASFLSAKESDEYQTDFCHMEDHRSLKEFYVTPTLNGTPLLHKDDGSGFSRMVVGPIGFGKTSLLKACLLSTLGELPQMFGINKNYLPVYIKLDRFNHITKETSLFDLAFGAGDEHFMNIVSSAEDLLIMIDGYDEVFDTKLLDKALTEFREKDKRANIIVTSRYKSPVFDTYEKITLKKFRKEEIERYLDIAVENDSSLRNRCEEIRSNRILSELASSPYSLYHEVYRCPGKPAVVLEHLLDETIERRWDIRKMEDIYTEDIKRALSGFAYNEIFVKSKEIQTICVSQKELEDYFFYASSEEDSYTRENSPLVSFARTMPIRSGVLSVNAGGNYSFSDEWLAKYLAAQYFISEFSLTRVFSALSEMLDNNGELTQTKLDVLALVMAMIRRKSDQKQLINYLLFRGFLSLDSDEQRNICATLRMIENRDYGDNSVLGIGSPYLSLIERLETLVDAG